MSHSRIKLQASHSNPVLQRPVQHQPLKKKPSGTIRISDSPKPSIGQVVRDSAYGLSQIELKADSGYSIFGSGVPKSVDQLNLSNQSDSVRSQSRSRSTLQASAKKNERFVQKRQHVAAMQRIKLNHIHALSNPKTQPTTGKAQDEKQQYMTLPSTLRQSLSNQMPQPATQKASEKPGVLDFTKQTKIHQHGSTAELSSHHLSRNSVLGQKNLTTGDSEQLQSSMKKSQARNSRVKLQPLAAIISKSQKRRQEEQFSINEDLKRLGNVSREQSQAQLPGYLKTEADNSRLDESIITQSNKLTNVGDVLIQTRSSNLLKLSPSVLTKSARSRQSQLERTNIEPSHSTLKQENSSTQCENEYMLLIATPNPPRQIKRSPPAANCPMSISPISQSHLKIFDQNFKKAVPRLPQRTESIVSLQASNKLLSTHKSGDILRQEFLNADLSLTPARVTSLASTIVENLREMDLRAKTSAELHNKQSGRDDQALINLELNHGSPKTSPLAPPQALHRLTPVRQTPSQKRDVQNLYISNSNSSHRKPEAQSQSPQGVSSGGPNFSSMRRTFTRLSSNSGNATQSSRGNSAARNHQRAKKQHLNWHQALRITKLGEDQKVQRCLKHKQRIDTQEPEPEDVSSQEKAMLKGVGSRKALLPRGGVGQTESRLFKQPSLKQLAGKLRPSTMIAHHIMLTPNFGANDDEQSSSDGFELATESQAPRETLAQLRKQAEEILQRPRKSSKKKKKKKPSASKGTELHAAESDLQMKKFKKLQRDFQKSQLAFKQDRDRANYPLGIFDTVDASTKQLLVTSGTVLSSQRVLPGSSHDINMFTFEEKQSSPRENKSHLTSNDQLKSQSKIEHNKLANLQLKPERSSPKSRTHRFEVTVTSSSKKVFDTKPQTGSLELLSDGQESPYVKRPLMKTRDEILDNEPLVGNSELLPSGKQTVATDENYQTDNPYPTMKTKFGSVSRDRLRKLTDQNSSSLYENRYHKVHSNTSKVSLAQQKEKSNLLNKDVNSDLRQVYERQSSKSNSVSSPSHAQQLAQPAQLSAVILSQQQSSSGHLKRGSTDLSSQSPFSSTKNRPPQLNRFPTSQM